MSEMHYRGLIRHISVAREHIFLRHKEIQDIATFGHISMIISQEMLISSQISTN